MSDSSTKSEGYSRLLKSAAVPSTPFFCYIVLIILISYSNITGLYGLIFTSAAVVLFILSLTLTAFRYRNYFNKRITATSHVLFLLTISAIICVYLNGQIKELTSNENLPDFISNVSVKIDKVKYKRYSSELHFSTQSDSGNKLQGILYFQGDRNPGRGDSIFIHKKIYRIKLLNNNNFSSYLISRGIHYTSGVSDNDITFLHKNTVSSDTVSTDSVSSDIISPDTVSSDTFLSGFAMQKNLLIRIDSIFRQPAAGVIKALLTGNQNYVDKNVILSYRNSGVLHTLAASGMHVGIFAAIPAFLLLPFFRKNIALLGSFLSVLLYLYITDLPVSLIRAVIMFGFFYLQSILFRNRNVFNYLMLTGSIILIISPWEIFSPGFQLSFGATAGIIMFYRQYLKSLKNLPSFISGTIAVTLSAQVFTIPVIIFHMNQFNTAGIVSNILIIPLISIIMGSSLFSILISFISTPAALLTGLIPEYVFRLSFLITGFLSDLKLNFFVYNITPAISVLMLISLAPLFNNKKLQKMKFYPVILSIILCTVYMKKNYSNNGKEFQIKAGNSTAEIKTEEEKQILKIDLDESADTEKIISEIKIKNPDIKIIELTKNSNSGLLLSRKILNDYIIEEYRFSDVPHINPMFKKMIYQLEKDNVIVKFI
jgi:ComEC/Rec2-related protein